MGIKMDKLIGDEAHFSIEHRILNIVLIFAFIISIWSAITNYLLALDPLLVWTCIISSAIMAGLYFLSVVKKQYTISMLVVVISVSIITPVSWILNGGISGSIPFYIILFSSMGSIVLFGIRRMAVIIYFIVISSVLVTVEYNHPDIIVQYSSVAERYIDILIGLITTIVANTVAIVVILRHYNKEHERAKTYLEESRKAQESLIYLSYHDALTGLYNRTYFEQAAMDIGRNKETGIGVFTVDVDGLKFINDTFGHAQGDFILIRAARILQSSFRAQDIIARIGGDEFVIIATGIAMNDMEAMYKRIRDNLQNEIKKFDEDIIPLHMSVGYAYSAGADTSVHDLLRKADSKMYREKLYHQVGTEGSIIQTVKKMLLARDYDTGVHSSRLKNLIAVFATKAGLPETSMADIQLFAEFHDVGKIGISDHTLHKPGPLTKDEREQIQRHCEIGYRIAQASNDLLPIAEWILKHHEWWNGEGYPLGIKGEEIPLECRIVAIADAYDAMTSDRPYRQAMSHDAAIEELKKYAGSQFDPELVEVFIQVIHSEHSAKGPGTESNI